MLNLFASRAVALDVFHRNNVQRIQGFDQVVIPQNSHDAFSDKNKFGVSHFKLPAVRHVKHERSKSAAHPQFDLLRVHRVWVTQIPHTGKSNSEFWIGQ